MNTSYFQTLPKLNKLVKLYNLRNPEGEGFLQAQKQQRQEGHEHCYGQAPGYKIVAVK